MKVHKRTSLETLETWPEERLKKYQFSKLKRVLTYAYQHLSFYRQRLDAAKTELNSIRNFQDFLKVPTFSKRDVLEKIKEKGSFVTGMEVPNRSAPAVLCMTSGTLGTSFLYLPEKWCSIRGGSLARAYRWGGLRAGMRMLMAAPAWHALAVQETEVVERLGATCVIPWGTFLPRYSDNFLRTIIDVKPDFVSIFLPMLYAILAECRRLRISPAEAFQSVQYVLAGGAPMTPRMREKLREDLRVLDIFEGLGNPEGLTAMECSFHCGHHIFLDCCYVEVVDPQTKEPMPRGKRGSVLVTSLIPYGSVYIRYDSEDIGEILPGKCECGRTWPRLEVYDRRPNIVCVAGREIVPYDVRLCLDEVPELLGLPFALIRGQSADNTLKLVLQKPPTRDEGLLEARLKSLIMKKLKLDSRPQWTEQLPERWKGVTVIEEKDWRALRV